MLKYIIFINDNFFLINRVDGHEEYFGLTNILYNNKMYDKYWNQDNYLKTYKELFRYGLKYQTKSRHVKTSLYGSTIGPTRYPQFIFRDSYRILPRPY